MYAGYFGLKEDPFSISPDPRYLFMGSRHREALAHLLFGLEARGGFVVLTGEIGTGKTTLCRRFLDRLPIHCRVAYVFNPRLDAVELLQTICDEFGVPLPHGPARPERVKALLDPLYRFLLDAHAQGQTCLLVIDEAQNLDPDVLEQLRLLTNLETHDRKLLQIVLIGQPELREVLARPSLEQLAQRVVARYHLGPLDVEETRQYVLHRLAVAGHQGPSLFSDAALRRVHRLSEGVPRRINLLCGRALLGASTMGAARVAPSVVTMAALEVFDRPAPAPSRLRPWLWMGGMVLGALAVWLALAYLPGQEPPEVQAKDAVFDDRAAASPPPATSAPHPPGSEPATASDPTPLAAGTTLAAAAEPATATAPPASSPVEPLQDGTLVRPLAPPSPSTPFPVRALLPEADRLIPEEALAWQALAPWWGLTHGDCETWPAQGVQCFRTARMTLDGLRQLDRPGVLLLHVGRRSGRALLVGLDARHAHLMVGQEGFRLPLTTLSRHWTGGYETLWRLPPGLNLRLDAGNASQAMSWTLEQLDALTARGLLAPARTDTPAPERLRAFQRAQGIEANGQPGPLTLIRLNRLTGRDEPRLQPRQP